MRYLIRYAVAGGIMSTFDTVEAETETAARERFASQHPGREVLEIRSGRAEDFALAGQGAWTEDERREHREQLQAQYDREKAARWKAEEDLFSYDIEEFAAETEYRTRRASEETQNAEGVHVGDLFYSSWGYDMTIIDFFQVVGLKGKHTALLRKIRPKSAETGFLRGISRPIRSAFLDEEIIEKRTRLVHGALRVGALTGAGYDRFAPVTPGTVYDWNRCD